MRIFEVTHRKIAEAAPGSAGAQTGSFLSGVGKALGAKLMPAGSNVGGPGPTFSGPSVTPAQAAGKAAEISGPAVAALAKTLQAQWSNTATAMMQKAMNPQTKTQGVQSIKDIDKTEMQRALISLVNGNLQRLNQRLDDYATADQDVDKTANQGKLPQMVKAMSAQIDAAIDGLLQTEPSRANAAKLAAFWNTIAHNSYGIANSAQFNPSGAGILVNPRASDDQLAQQANRAGLTTKQLGITTKIAPTRDPAMNKLLASVGALQQQPQTAAVAAESRR